MRTIVTNRGQHCSTITVAIITKSSRSPNDELNITHQNISVRNCKQIIHNQYLLIFLPLVGAFGPLSCCETTTRSFQLFIFIILRKYVQIIEIYEAMSRNSDQLMIM